MSNAGWGGAADTGFSGVPPEIADTVQQWMDEGPPAVAVDPPPFSQSDYDHRRFTMIRFLAPYRWPLFGVFLLVTLEAVMSQAGPLLLQISIDEGIRKGDRGLVSTISVVFAIFVPVSIAVGVVRTMVAGRVGARIMANLRVQVFSHFQRLSIDYYTTERAGRLLSRMTSDLEPLQQLFQQGLVQLAVQAVTLAAVTVALFLLNPLLALVTLIAVVPGTLALSLWYRNVAATAQIRVRDTIADVLAHLQESLAGIRLVTAHNRRKRAVIEHQNEAGEYLAANDRTAFINGVYGPGSEAMGPFAQMILLVVGGRRVLDGRGRRVVGAAGRATTVADRRTQRAASALATSGRHHLRSADRRVADGADALARRAHRTVTAAGRRLDGHAVAVAAADPDRALARGWSITRRADGTLIRRAGDVAEGDVVVTTVADGVVRSTVHGADDAPTPTEEEPRS